MLVMFLLLQILSRLKRWLDMAPLRRSSRDVPWRPTQAMRSHPKPLWVRRELIRLKALSPDLSCRVLAEIFNRQFAQRRVSVGKTFVATVLRQSKAEIVRMRRQLKHRVPAPMPANRIWALDLTGKADLDGTQRTILGLIDHGSNAWTMKAALALLGVRLQTIQLHCPWQNGRVERFFGTLKRQLDRTFVADGEDLRTKLIEFRCWYNHVRPHQHLRGHPPAEVWDGRSKSTGKPRWFSAWDARISGWWFPP